LGELRKDYILDRWVIINPKRGKRPHQFVDPPHEEKHSVFFFCPGNEHMTPDEVGRREKDGKWTMRWFRNKFAAVNPKGESDINTADTFFTYSSNYGIHEVFVETADHKKQLVDLSINEIKGVLEVYRDRIIDLESQPNIGYVNVFKNRGPKAGTSIIHSHSQIIATNKLSPEIEQKLDAVKEHDSCPYCKVIEIEKKSHRRCFENDNFAAFAPYASRFNYEVWIFPKKHLTRMEDLNLHDLADILHKVIDKLHAPNWSYNIAVQYSPKGEDLHFHLMIMPRIAKWAGFELGSGIIINSVAPEDAAKFYRGENGE